MKNNKGFTLIEVLAVVIILGVLASISFPIVRRIFEMRIGRRLLNHH